MRVCRINVPIVGGWVARARNSVQVAKLRLIRSCRVYCPKAFGQSLNKDQITASRPSQSKIVSASHRRSPQAAGGVVSGPQTAAGLRKPGSVRPTAPARCCRHDENGCYAAGLHPRGVTTSNGQPARMQYNEIGHHHGRLPQAFRPVSCLMNSVVYDVTATVHRPNRTIHAFAVKPDRGLELPVSAGTTIWPRSGPRSTARPRRTTC